MKSNHIFYDIMTLCIANVVVVKLHQFLKETEKNWDISKVNISNISRDIKTEVKRGLFLKFGKKIYQKVQKVVQLGIKTKNGALKLLKNYVEKGIKYSEIKTPIGKGALTKKSEDLGVREIICELKKLLEKGTKFVSFVAQTKIYTLTISNHLLIIPNCDMNQAISDYFALNVTKRQTISVENQGEI